MTQRHGCFKVNIYPSQSKGSSKHAPAEQPRRTNPLFLLHVPVPQWQEGSKLPEVQVTREMTTVIKPA